MRIGINLATRPFADLGPTLKRLRIAMGVLALAAIGLIQLHTFFFFFFFFFFFLLDDVLPLLVGSGWPQSTGYDPNKLSQQPQRIPHPLIRLEDIDNFPEYEVEADGYTGLPLQPHRHGAAADSQRRVHSTHGYLAGPCAPRDLSAEHGIHDRPNCNPKGRTSCSIFARA